MRPIKPAAPARPRYPRLLSGWRLLVGAAPLALLPSLALGDASVPKPGNDPGHKDGKKQRPQPRPQPIPDPPLGGAPPMPNPPEPPKDLPRKDPDKPKLGVLLHPHGPDEPCFPLDRFFRVKV